MNEICEFTLTHILYQVSEKLYPPKASEGTREYFMTLLYKDKFLTTAFPDSIKWCDSVAVTVTRLHCTLVEM